MTKKALLITFFGLLATLAWLHPAQAGFGISPPYVRSDKIIPGSHYEQIIVLLRSSAEEALAAKIELKAPEIESWVSFDKGTVFDLPPGELQVPLIISVDVPSNADLGNYTGYINVSVMPKKADGGAGGVAIALGARIDIDLTVSEDAFPDFLIRIVKIQDMETLGRPWNWPIFAWFFYRVKAVMTIENTGNVDVAPTKVTMDIYDIGEKELLESHTDRHLNKIEPYSTGDVVASFPIKLNEGQYWGKIKIYKENQIVRSNKIAFTVTPPGGLGTNMGIKQYGYKPWLLLGAYLAVILLFIFVLIKIKIWRHGFKLLLIITWPARYLWRKIKNLFKKLKMKFWQWLHRKSAKYQQVQTTPHEDAEDDTDQRKE